MNFLTNKNEPALINLLQSGGVAILRTDTLYGFVARADVESAVERIFQTKGRQADKRFIILIADLDQLYDQANVDTSQYWPGPNSLILPAPSAHYWLLRGETTLAYRMPADESLRALLRRTGPLVAPSANPEGELPATNIQTAYDYFGENVDLYVDEGEVPADTPPSKLLRISADGNVERLR